MSTRCILQLISIVYLLSFGKFLYSQTDTLYYLDSDFETSEDQAQWTSKTPDGELDADKEWVFDDPGGHEAHKPVGAASGDNNALFHQPSVSEVISRLLVSPKIDLSSAGKPGLSFQHAQVAGFEQDEMYLLFKAGSSASWDTVRKWEDAIDEWTSENINLDEEGAQYLCEDFQLAFLGFSKSDNGVVVDSVVIVENDTIPKFVKSLSYAAVDTDLITSKAVQVPLVQVYVRVSGNDGSSNLKSISFKLEEGEESFFKTSGFSLYHTTGDLYRNEIEDTSTMVMENVSISSGIVTFSGLNHGLKLGDNYLWLAADMADDIDYNSLVQFGVEANSFSFNDTLLPSAAINNIMSAYTSEAVFFDNFETDKSWSLGGDFERGEPLGLSNATKTTKDPAYTYSGTNVLGTNLSTDEGLYTSNITPSTAYHAESPTVDLKYYNNVKLYFRNWSDFYSSDSTTISVSNDGGTTWTRVWYNVVDNPGFSQQWKAVLIDDEDATDLMNRMGDVKVRFSMNKTGSNPECGFNIDQFTILGNHIDTDVGITEIISPFDDCRGFNNDTVKVVLRNYAEAATPDRIPVYFALWGTDSTIVRDTVETSIAQDDSLIFTFSEQANFPRGDVYDKFKVGIELDGDEDASNDTLVKSLYIQESNEPPVLTDFEYKGGVWIPDDESVWKCITPSSIPILTDSPNSWLLYPYGTYANNDTRYLTSGCYDLTGENQYIVQFEYELLSDTLNDGFAIEYSTDDGDTWNLVDTTIYGRNWGWYTGTVAALGHIGMSGSTNGWAKMKEMLPALTANKVKFRVKWASDTSIVYRGLAFDNFELFPAPNDVGVVAITQPDSACQYVNEDTVSVYVKNFGVNNLHVDDTIIVGVDFESEAPVIDTFKLAAALVPGDSVLLKVPVEMDIDNAGTYSLIAYTLIEDDPDFYGTYNDTLSKEFTVWPNPISGMVDSLFSRKPKTLIIEPHWEANYSYEWFDATTDSIHGVDKSDMYYSVTITESDHSCQTKDSTYVQLLFNDVGVDSITWPVSSCSLNANELVEVTIKNKGTDSLIVGDTIYVSYSVNGGAVHKDSITLTSPLYKGQTIDHIFSETYDFSGIGDYTITAYTEFDADTVGTNDTIINTISVYGYPVVDLGPDVVSQTLSYTLDAGSGFSAYLWSNDSTDQSIEVTTSDTYWVQVTDVHGCSDSDTIDVFLKIRDVTISAMDNPVNSCARDAEEQVILEISNNGTDTIPATETITVKYSLDGAAMVEETHTLSADLLPNSTVTHTFTGTEDLSTFTTYDFVAIAQISNDLVTGNDTLEAEITTYETPSVDLGEDRTITNQTQITLDAGAGSNLEYLWYNGTTNQTLTAEESRTYWVTVTNSVTSCYDQDTVKLTFDVTDYAVQNIDLEDAPCQGEYDDVVVTVSNNGTLPRDNATIKIGVQVGDNDAVVEQFEVTETWPSGGSKDFTLSNPISLSDVVGSVIVKVYLDQEADNESGNDELDKSVNVQESPDVDLGGGKDTLQVSFPYTLDAETSDATSYLWQDNKTTTSTFEATFSALYTVVVTNANNCITIDSVFLEEGSYVHELTLENIDVNIYPVPVEEYLNIEANLDFVDELTIELYDATGRVYYYEEGAKGDTYTGRIDVSSLSKGVYLLRIRSDEVYYVKTIIIQ